MFSIKIVNFFLSMNTHKQFLLFNEKYNASHKKAGPLCHFRVDDIKKKVNRENLVSVTSLNSIHPVLF